MGRLLPKCEQLVSEALGRPITKKESENVIPLIRSQYTRLMGSDPSFKNLSHDERVRMAAQAAAHFLREDVQFRRNRLAKQVLAIDKNMNIYDNLNAKGFLGSSAVAERMEQVANSIKAVRQELMSSFIDGFKALGEGKLMGLLENRDQAHDVVRALFGERALNDESVKGAQVIKDSLEAIRQRYNDLGGNIKALKDYVLPQSHDTSKIAHAAFLTKDSSFIGRKVETLKGLMNHTTMDDHREAWVNFIYDKLDRSRYIDMDTGAQMDDDAYRGMLNRVFDTLITDGLANPTAIETSGVRRPGTGKKGDNHRALHFKDSDAWMEYEGLFGHGNVTMTLTGHINSMGREIALMQELGPSPMSTYNNLKAQADADFATAKLKHGEAYAALHYLDAHGTAPFLVTTDMMWQNLSGAANMISGTGMNAGAAQAMRTLQCGGKLGAAFISSFSDIGTYFVTAKVHGASFTRALDNLIKGFRSADSEFAQRHGILADKMNATMARWGEENIGTGLINTLTEATMRLSLLEAWTNGVRQSMGFLLMETFGRLKKTDWQKLAPMDKARIEEAGLTELDWLIIQNAQTTAHDGHELLTMNDINEDVLERLSPELVQAYDGNIDINATRTKYLAFLYQEMHMASLDPNLRTRTMTNLGLQKGTFPGELARSFMLFKSFPFGMISSHFRRASQYWRHGEKASAVAYTGALVASTTVLGAISLQAANLIGGRDLQDMETVDFWANAFLKGGGLGFYGDILYNGLIGENRYGAPNLIGFAGPVFGTFMDAWDLGTSVFNKNSWDKDTKAGAKAIRLARSNTPLVNLWYVKGVLDRAVFNDLQEMSSPGYLQRQEKRMMKSTGQGFWWRNSALPERLPRMAKDPH